MKNMFLKFDKNNKDAGLSNEIFETNFFYEYENFDFFGPINRVNIFVGANNSGKSRLLRGILKNKNQILLSSISIYNILYSIRRINKEIMSKMREDNEEIVIDFDFEKLNPTEQRQFHKEFLNLEKGNDLSCRIKRDGYIFKIVFNIIYFGEKFHNDLFTTWLNYNNESRKDNFIKLINHHKLILDFISKWETRIRTTSRKIQLYLKLLLELASWLEKFKKAIEETKITLSNYNKIYIPVLRTASSLFGNENNKINYDIFKTSISTNYKINLSNESSIELSTGLDFYNSIKRIRNDFKPKRKKFENFENFISENFFNNNPVDIVAKESDDQKEKNIIIHFEEEDEEREIHNLGDGIQSIIMLMFPIFTAEDKSWIFIEEPEVNLHPGLQRLFLEQLMNNEIIKKKELTIFFSTHSNHLLDISLTNEKGISIFTFEKQKKKRRIHL
ncbi:MAG: ATP-binding protein [Armatimonadetes bacterium]|nr:ATP-binding protein [Armatimonadota bacterium]